MYFCQIYNVFLGKLIYIFIISVSAITNCLVQLRIAYVNKHSQWSHGRTILHLSNTISSRNKVKRQSFVFICVHKWAYYVKWPIRAVTIVKLWLNIEDASGVLKTNCNNQET